MLWLAHLSRHLGLKREARHFVRLLLLDIQHNEY
jgi:hypothetical protein